MILLYISGIVCLTLLVSFAVVMLCEPRTLWSGGLFVSAMLSLSVTALFALYAASDWLGGHVAVISLLIFLAFLALGCVLLFPFALTALFLIEGIRVIRHEGIKPVNLLSVLFALLFFACVTVWPAVGNPGKTTAGRICFTVAACLAVYGLMLLAVYALSAVLNLIHIKKRRNMDYILVLGAGLAGKMVTPLLAARIDKGIGLLRQNPDAVMILSGGQGPGEEAAECEAMADYAMKNGVRPDRIIMEPEAASTRENLLFSYRLMEKRRPSIAIVTTDYHVFRALILARKEGIRCVGYGAKTTWYFALNAFLREFSGYLSLTFKGHLLTALLLAGIVSAWQYFLIL